MNISELLKKSGLDPETLLSLLNEDTIPGIARLFGLDEKLLFAVSRLAPAILGGQFDLTTLLPTLIPVALSYFLSLKEPNEKIDPQSYGVPAEEEIEIINEFKKENEAEFSPLELYLQSSSAS